MQTQVPIKLIFQSTLPMVGAQVPQPNYSSRRQTLSLRPIGIDKKKKGIFKSIIDSSHQTHTQQTRIQTKTFPIIRTCTHSTVVPSFNFHFLLLRFRVVKADELEFPRNQQENLLNRNQRRCPVN